MIRLMTMSRILIIPRINVNIPTAVFSKIDKNLAESIGSAVAVTLVSI